MRVLVKGKFNGKYFVKKIPQSKPKFDATFNQFYSISDDDQGPFSISLLKLSQLKAKSWSQSSNWLQIGFLSCVQVSDLGEILTWDSS